MCKFGKFLYGSERSTLESLFPGIKTELKAIEGPHAKLHESAISIIDNWKQVHPGLEKTLFQRMDDHRVWLHNLSNSILTDTEITVQMDPTKCAFGKWIGSDELKSLCKSWEPFGAKVTEITPLHVGLHDSARLIANAGTIEEKKRIYNENTSKVIQELSIVFRSMNELEEALMSGQQKSIEIFRSETNGHMEDVMGHLHVIGDELDVERNKIQADLVTSTQRAELVVLLVSFVVIGLGVGASVVLIRLITNPIQSVRCLLPNWKKETLLKDLRLSRRTNLVRWRPL